LAGMEYRTDSMGGLKIGESGIPIAREDDYYKNSTKNVYQTHKKKVTK